MVRSSGATDRSGATEQGKVGADPIDIKVTIGGPVVHPRKADFQQSSQRLFEGFGAINTPKQHI